MKEIRYLRGEDKQFWYSLDKHLPEAEFDNNVYTKRDYILLEFKKPIKVLDKGIIKQLKTQGPTYNKTPPLETIGGVFAYIGKLRRTQYGQGEIILSIA